MALDHRKLLHVYPVSRLPSQAQELLPIPPLAQLACLFMRIVGLEDKKCCDCPT